jgi:hypothetical protein
VEKRLLKITKKKGTPTGGDREDIIVSCLCLGANFMPNLRMEE